jgi:membrane fusion protein (multidrug efflux system)
MADGASIHRVPAEPATAAESPTAPARLDAVRELRRPTPEAEPPAAPEARPAAEQPASPIVAKLANSPGRDWKRPLLFGLLPVALVAGGYFYATGGQIASTDNAYVQADMVGVSTDVPGPLVSIEVHDRTHSRSPWTPRRLSSAPFTIRF